MPYLVFLEALMKFYQLDFVFVVVCLFLTSLQETFSSYSQVKVI